MTSEAAPTVGTISLGTAWMVLIVAGLLEVGMALGLKYAEGFTKLWPSVAAVVFGAASMLLLSIALKAIPAGTGYAVWTGIGSVGVAIVGIVFIKEPATLLKFACIGLIIAGVAGLHLTEKH